MPKRTKPAYNRVALGGTFDRFHKGHEHLLSRAFELGKTVLIGVTNDSYIRKLRKPHPVQPYPSRVKSLRNFLRQKKWIKRTIIAPLHDPYGPPAYRRDIEALVITADTISNASKLNRIRRHRGLKPLKIVNVKLLRAEDGNVISSTRIRNRAIDRNGRVLK